MCIKRSLVKKHGLFFFRVGNIGCYEKKNKTLKTKGELNMGKRVFKTTWNRNQNFGEDEFYIGKLIGIAVALDILKSENGLSYGVGANGSKRYINVYCTEEEYERFKELVENYVFFECEFDVK